LFDSKELIGKALDREFVAIAQQLMKS